MSTAILALLAAYYACDVAATEGLSDLEHAGRCSAVYQEVKSGFLDPEERLALERTGADRGAAEIMGFHRFKAWEDENRELVERLRSGALTASLETF